MAFRANSLCVEAYVTSINRFRLRSGNSQSCDIDGKGGYDHPRLRAFVRGKLSPVGSLSRRYVCRLLFSDNDISRVNEEFGSARVRRSIRVRKKRRKERTVGRRRSLSRHVRSYQGRNFICIGNKFIRYAVGNGKVDRVSSRPGHRLVDLALELVVRLRKLGAETPLALSWDRATDPRTRIINVLNEIRENLNSTKEGLVESKNERQRGKRNRGQLRTEATCGYPLASAPAPAPRHRNQLGVVTDFNSKLGDRARPYSIEYTLYGRSSMRDETKRNSYKIWNRTSCPDRCPRNFLFEIYRERF